jgi:N-acetylneuraminate synthase
MHIDGREIGTDHPPYLIAEMSNNHLCNLDRAIAIIDAAVDAGADAVKIQTYTADSLTIDCDKADFIIQDPLWYGKSYYKLYQEIAMPLEWTQKIFTHAKKRGITLFSSPFDEQTIELLENLNCPAYKIASFEAQDKKLIQRIAQTKKPIIISSGVSTLLEMRTSLDLARAAGAREIAVLHCVSSYPCSTADMNLKALIQLKALSTEIGLSDHSLSNLAAITSIALGASIIEKHLTLNRNDGGPDAAFSLEPNEFQTLVQDSRAAYEALGNANVLAMPKRKGFQHARSLYATRDIKAGTKLDDSNVRLIRPGFGLPPCDMEEVMGAKAKLDIERGTALKWSLIDKKSNQ